MTVLGKVLSWYDWDFGGAVDRLKRAIRLNPNYAEAHFTLGSVLPCLGHLSRPLESMRTAADLDPLHGEIGFWLARFLHYGGDDDAAIAQSLKALETHPHFYRLHVMIGHAYLQKGDPEAALEQYRRAQALEGSVPAYDAFIARGLAMTGQEEKASRILAGLVERSRDRYIRPEMLAIGFAALGEIDTAMDHLEEALEARSAGLVYLLADPMYRPLAGEPRFQAVVKAVGLSEISDPRGGDE